MSTVAFLAIVFAMQPPVRALDGQVSGLPKSVFAALQGIKKLPGSSFTPAEAQTIAEAIQQDKNIDEAERDLLAELTRKEFLPCVVRGEGGATLELYTQSGTPRLVFQDLLYPQPHFAREWQSGGSEGYKKLVAYSQLNETNKERVLTFMEGRLRGLLPASGEDYKLLKDEIDRIHRYVEYPGTEAAAGRELLYKAISSLDQKHDNRIPDTLYSKVREVSPFAVTPPKLDPSEVVIDGKVSGLNPETFAVLQAIKKRNPGAFTEGNANELRATLLKDNQLDVGERDLLEEMTQSQFRSITVTLAGSSTEKVTSYPISGNARKVFQDILKPPLNLEGAWQNGQAGFKEIITEYKERPSNETRVIQFVAGKLEAKWTESNIGNGYKPLRDQIGQLYSYSNSLGSDVNTGRTILYKSMKLVDQKNKDAIPDFLYNWTRPGGYL